MPYRLEISTTSNELTLLREGVETRTFPVAAGHADQPRYGRFAYGLFTYSEVLNEFGGSHCCILMASADITALTELLPLGTPVVIS